MSHHFDSATALNDGRLDLCDLFVFEGRDPQTTVFILTVNPFAGIESPTIFHPQGVYEFKIDINGDFVEEISYRVSFGTADTNNTQPFELHRAEGERAQAGRTGQLLASGHTNITTHLSGGGRIWIGLAADPFAGNAQGLDRFNMAIAQNSFAPDVFAQGSDAFAQQNITGIVLELPTAALGAAPVHVWAAVSLWHPEEHLQINRGATPLLLHLYLVEEADRLAFTLGHPRDDLERSGAIVAARVALVTQLANSAENPTAYGQLVARALLPDVLTYDTCLPASYSFALRNGRRLSDDGFDVVLSILTKLPLANQTDNVGRYQSIFPYLAPPFGR